MVVAGDEDRGTGTTVQTFCFWNGMQAVGRGPVGVVRVGGTSALGPPDHLHSASLILG